MKRLLHRALIGMGLGLGAPTLRAQATHQLPPRALIVGVPFISWSEAASLDYANKDVLNPSLPASEGMVLKYWGRDLTALKQQDQTAPGWTQRGGDSGSVESLKTEVSRGIPVIVCLAMTPIAHNPGPGAAAMMAMSDSTVRDALQRGGWSSGVLGQMVALDTLRRWGQVVGTETLRESAFMACRVVIGYDDPRKVIILQDPSFGPAWELSYADFENMWSFWNRLYVAMYPDDFARILAKRVPAPPYPARTAAQHAAEEYVYGYALASVGRRNEAEARLKAGLAIPDLPSGYRHLMLLDVARLAEARHDTATAVATYRQAAELLPQDNRSWLFLGQLLQHDGHAGSQKEAASLLGRATALCADTSAQQAAWRALPHDYVMMGGCEESAAAEPTAPGPTPQLRPDEIRYLLPTRGWEVMKKVRA
jgi:tetratricopeptide (TPR) repeat protein